MKISETTSGIISAGNHSGKITGCVIVQNEERSLLRCLESLAFCHEVVVVDGGSRDRTFALASQWGERWKQGRADRRFSLLQNPFTGFTAQRNFALTHAQGDWVLFLDADEAVTPEAALSLQKVAEQDMTGQPRCYEIQRHEFFLGQHLLWGPGNPSYQWRFFQRRQVVFVGDVHEYPQFEGGVGRLSGAIDHWPHLGVDRFLTKLNHYTTLEALDRFAQGQRTSLTHACLTFFSTFFKNGLRYGGFFNGRVGLVLVLLESFSRVVRHLKLWVFWQVHEGRLSLDLGFSLPSPGSRKPPSVDELNKQSWESGSDS